MGSLANIPELDSLPDGLKSIMLQYEKRIKFLEERVSDQAYDLTGFVDSVFKRRDRRELHRTTEFSSYKAWCVDTLDPRKQGRVRYFSPYLHEVDTYVDSLPFAEPISWCGGFDDSGCTWIPPAGSTLVLIFEAGSSHIAYYLGTMWPRDRGHYYWDKLIKEGIPEYKLLHEGHRKGYFHGPCPGDCDDPNDERQVLPQWNTENYDAYDWNGITPDLNKRPNDVHYPHIYGFKTNQKHMIKFDDGDYMCDHRWKRLEIMSSLGNWMLFKDDHLHEAEWPNPQCDDPCPGPIACCRHPECPTMEPDECGAGLKKEARNKYFKHMNECRPYKGPQTPQNNRCELPQAGVQILSTSGHSIVMDDSVHKPVGVPRWEKVLEPFSFGCDNIYIGKFIQKSTTGHRIEMNDEEKAPTIRGRHEPIERPCDRTWDPWKQPILERGDRPARNGILLLTACGNRVELNDDTDGCIAGLNRGISLQSTSNHVIEMIDHLNTQCSPRKEGGVPTPNAKHAWIRIRSGYGLCMEFRDDFSQQKTQQQYIQIFSPQYDACCGPHIIRIQEKPSCGYIFVRAAGDYYRITAGHEVIVVGQEDGCLGPRNHFRFVTDNTIVATKNLYYNYANIHLFFAEKYIILAAGRDCPCPEPDCPSPCLYQVATSKCAMGCPIIPCGVCLRPESFSTRVFASNDNKKCCGDDS